MKKMVGICLLIILMLLFGCNYNTTNSSTTDSMSVSEENIVNNKEMTLSLSFGGRTGIYTGELLNGLPHGFGSFSSQSSEGKKWIYDGEWINGHFNGTGRMTWEDGTWEIGYYENDELVDLDEKEASKIITDEPDFLLYHDDFVEIYFAKCDIDSYDSQVIYLQIDNLTDYEIEISCNTISLDRTSLSDLSGTHSISPQSVGVVKFTQRDQELHTMNPKTVGGSIRIWESTNQLFDKNYYDAVFTNIGRTDNPEKSIVETDSKTEYNIEIYESKNIKIAFIGFETSVKYERSEVIFLIENNSDIDSRVEIESLAFDNINIIDLFGFENVMPHTSIELRCHSVKDKYAFTNLEANTISGKFKMTNPNYRSNGLPIQVETCSFINIPII